MANNPAFDGPALEKLWGEADWLHRCALELGYGPSAAEDAVQETLLLAAQEQSAEESQRLGRGWLRFALRRRLGMARRAEERRSYRERVMARPEAVELDPASAMERLELGRQLHDAVASLPQRDREVLALRYAAGLTPKEIGLSLGESSNAVSSRLSRALSRVRERLDPPEESTRGLSALLLVTPKLASAIAAFTSHSVSLGLVLMKKQTITALVLIIAAFGSVAVWRMSPVQRGDAVTAKPEALANLVGIEPRAGVSAPPRNVVEDDARVALEAPVAATTEPKSEPAAERMLKVGSVRVLVTEAVTGAPAEGVGFRLFDRSLRAKWNRARSWVTDAAGVAVVEGLPVGKHSAYLGRVAPGNSFEAKRFDVVAGARASVHFEVDGTLTTNGVVVDDNGQGVAGAQLWVGSQPGRTYTGYVAGTSGPDGRFALRYVHGTQMVAASKEGYAPSLSGSATIGRENGDDVVLQLSRTRGSLHGVVVDRDGEPVVGATVALGELLGPAPYEGEGLSPYWTTPVQTLTSGERGEFHFRDARVGDAHVEVRSSRTSLWSETVTITGGGDTRAFVELSMGGGLEGTVRLADGEPVPFAMLSLRDDVSDMVLGRVEVAADSMGHFSFEHLTPGTRKILVESPDYSRSIMASLEVVDGVTSPWDPVLPESKEFRGIVTSEAGEPLKGWWVSSSPIVDGAAEGSNLTVLTRKDGSFSFAPELGERFQLEVFSPGGLSGEPAVLLGSIAPTGELLELRVPAAKVPTAALVGRVVDTEGAPVRAIVELRVETTPATNIHFKTNADGRFEFPYAPEGEFVLRYSLPGGTVEEWASDGPLMPSERRDVGALTIRRMLSGTESSGRR
jgi:RNA polymerase sigma-70 factor (ECF subfamily)